MKRTTILNIVILHPFIIGLIWSVFAGIMSLIPDMLLGLAMTPYTLVEAGMFVMIITSILMYWLMMKKKYLSSRYTKIVLIFSNILFMAMLYLVYDIYPDFLPGGEGPVMGIGIFLYLTLAATGVFLLALLIISMIEHIFRKKAVKKQALEQTDK